MPDLRKHISVHEQGTRWRSRTCSFSFLPTTLSRAAAVVLKHMALHEAGDILGLASDIEFTPKNMQVLLDHDKIAAKKKKTLLKKKKKNGEDDVIEPAGPIDALENSPGARSKLEQAAQFF